MIQDENMYLFVISDVEVTITPDKMKALCKNGKPEPDSRHKFWFSLSVQDPKTNSNPQKIRFFLDRLEKLGANPGPGNYRPRKTAQIYIK